MECRLLSGVYLNEDDWIKFELAESSFSSNVRLLKTKIFRKYFFIEKMLQFAKIIRIVNLIFYSKVGK